MSELPLVTVVVPCMNRASLLRPTIDSILSQDYPNVECIVVDAASKDGTVEILKSYGDRIRWVSEPDKGHADAINKGWRMGRGEIVAWLNADDIYEAPSGVRRAVEHLVAHPEVDLVYGNCGSIDINGNMTGMSYLHAWDLAYAVEQCDHCIPQPAAFMRRAIVEKVGWLDIDFYQMKDHELWLRIGLAGKIAHLPELVAYARDIEGLTFDGLTAGPAMVQVTRKFFSLPNVPPELRRRKWRAMSNSCLRALDKAWDGGRHWSLVCRYAMLACVYSPTNSLRALGRFLLCLRNVGIDGRGPAWLFWLVRMAGVLFVLRAIARSYFVRPFPRNLGGDREIENAFVAGHLPEPTQRGQSRALDFGNGNGPMSIMAAERGYRVTSIDLLPVSWPYKHPYITFLQGDLLKLDLPEGAFDVVLNLSTVEHVGLAGRYDIADAHLDGDLEAMTRLRSLLRPGGVMVMTIPVGRDTIHFPMCRVYGSQRLPQLIAGFEVHDEAYWIKNSHNKWVRCPRATALDEVTDARSDNPMRCYYALGCLVLRRCST